MLRHFTPDVELVNNVYINTYYVFFFISSDCTRVQISILNMLSRYTTNTLYLSLF